MSRSLIIYLTAARAVSLICSAIQISTPLAYFRTSGTIFYGGNGSGKSTLLNVIAEKLRLPRTAPFNNSPIIDDYIKLCEYRLGSPYLPDKSSIITSDGVFDYLLDIRAINEGIDRRREELLREYDATVKSDWQMKSLDD